MCVLISSGTVNLATSLDLIYSCHINLINTMSQIREPEFRLEVALLIVYKGYSVREAAQEMNVGK